MAEQELNIPVRLDDQSPQSWKELRRAIIDTKSELIKLQNEGKRGTVLWDENVNKLKELTRTKQILARETQITGQRLLAMSRDLTVLNFGVRQAINDFNNFNATGKTFEETVKNATDSTLKLSTTVLALAPAVKSLSIELGISAVAMSAVGAALAGMYIFITKLPEQLTHLGRAFRFLSGEISFSEGVAEFERLQGAIDNTTLSVERLQRGIWNVIGFQKFVTTVPTKEERTPQQLINSFLYGKEQDRNKTPIGGIKGKTPTRIEVEAIEESLGKIAQKLGALQPQIDEFFGIGKAITETLPGVPLIAGKLPKAGKGKDPAEIAKENSALMAMHFETMLSSTANMLSNMNLMDTTFGRIVAMIQNILNTGKSAFDLFGAIVGIVGGFGTGGVGGAIVGGAATLAKGATSNSFNPSGVGGSLANNFTAGMTKTVYIVPQNSVVKGRDIHTVWNVEENLSGLSGI